jgi:hypothetical protein
VKSALEETIKILILLHSEFWGVTLLDGCVSMIAKKGLLTHKKSGLLFYHSMLISAIIAMSVEF